MEFNRRMWLRGAAGFTLALPFLPSLAPRSAQAGPAPARRRFIALGTEHGCIRQANMLPDASKLPDQLDYAGHKVRRGDLALTVSGGRASLSPVLSASASLLTPALVKKMNVLRGFDVVPNLGHHRGGHLGNFADNDGNLEGQMGLAHRPTIDQVLAWSKSFYPSLDTIKERSLHGAVWWGDGNLSWGYANPSTQSGTIQPLNIEYDSLALFNKIFVPPTTGPQRTPLVDLVLEDYKRVRHTSRRLSAADRQRLDDYMGRMSELQRKLKVNASCGSVTVPTTSSSKVREGDPSFDVNPVTQAAAWQLVNDVVVAAFACDTSRIATLRVGDTEIFSNFTGSWHHEVAHLAWKLDDLTPQQNLVASRQRIFEHVFLDLAAKLDAVQEVDGTLLDSTLLQFTQEAGPSTHSQREMPVITAGSAAGALRTGHHCDYRNLDAPGSGEGTESVTTHRGLLYNQWLGTVLQAMGLPPSEYESGGLGGYGLFDPKAPDAGAYDGARQVVGGIVPFLGP
ncbi:MAG: DUF1552 domain-containing protein [Myxococcales bacterium]|nr:MAG: DUF1552 domain-containing protein [Myxococcales bacterium]